MDIPLEIKSKSSKFDGKILLESVNISILKKLLDPCNRDLLKSYDAVNREDTYVNEYAKKTYCTEYDQLTSYMMNMKFNKVFVRYDKTQNLNGYGRVFPSKSLGLFSFRKQIRGALTYGIYEDIDIVNCHPILMLQIAKHNNLSCKYLEMYVMNREKYLARVMETYSVCRNYAKDLFIILLYLGSFEAWKYEYGIESNINLVFINNLSIELKNIGSALMNNNQDLADLIIKKHEKYNKIKTNYISSTVSFILQEYECQIIETLYDYCTFKKIINNDCVLCADGIMIKCDKYYDGLLSEFNTIIKEKMGFDLTFTNKPLNTEIYDKLK